MFGEMLLLGGVALLTWAFYKWVTLNNGYFERRNLKYMKPSFLFGNTGGIYFQKYNAVEFRNMIYNQFPDESVYGIFNFRMPQYVVRCPEIIKRIGIKDFDYFQDHRSFADAKTDEIWGNNLFQMKGENWRQMRTTLSPAFTGSKMRQMFELILESADGVASHLLKCSSDGKRVNLEMEDFFSRITNDVIATCAFGIKIDSLAEPKNEFYVNGKKLLNFSGMKKNIKRIIMSKMPPLARALKLKVIEGFFADSFKKIILETMEIRKNRDIFRPDMINILMQVRNGSFELSQTDEKTSNDTEEMATLPSNGKMALNRKWSDDEIVAQCFIFFFAGYNTVSTLLTFVSYELIVNPDIQQKLYEEIAQVSKQLDGKRIVYDTLQKMEYLDQVICETLRKWPPVVQIDRVCVKDHTFDNGDGLRFNIEKGTSVIFPIFGIQRDPKYFAHPEKFDPDRFSENNKDNIRPGSYLPFGIGPRNCIGSRFALMEVKAILYQLLVNFSFETNERTQIPLQLKRTPIFLSIDNGMHLALKPRNK